MTALEAALLRLARTPHLLIALDFDGTLAPIVSHAAHARPLPRSAAALAALASLESTTTALVSGRALASLRAVAAPPAPTLLVGSHGAETWLGPESPLLAPTAAQQAALEAARTAVELVVKQFPGTMAEHKPVGVVLHYRLASEAHGRAAVALLQTLLKDRADLFLSTGKKVLEVSAVRADKGQSLTMLRELTGATATFFAGDDVTDEHALAALRPGDVGVKVGPGATAAAYRVASPEDMPEVLESLLAARRRHLKRGTT